MKKSTKMVKKLLALFLVVLISIESFGAVVSDNDGSAFVSKAEFEALKKDFSNQIDNYNTSIDSKIDGAIASYLSGIKTSKKSKSLILCSNVDEVTMLGSSNVPEYVYGRLGLAYNCEYVRNSQWITDYLQLPFGTMNWDTELAANATYVGNLRYRCKLNCSATSSKKLLIESEVQENGLFIAPWLGFCEDCKESLNGFLLQKILSGPSLQLNNYMGGLVWNPTTEKNELFAIRTDLFYFLFGASAGDSIAAYPNNPVYLASNGATFQYNDMNYETICLFDDGNYTGDFSIKNSTIYLMNDPSKTELRSNWRVALSLSNTNNHQWRFALMKDGTWSKTVGYDQDGTIFLPTVTTTLDGSYCAPQFGFSPKITHWNQLYNKTFDNLFYTKNKTQTTEKHVYLKDGLPLIQAQQGNKIKYTFTFSDTSDYKVYLKYGKFNGAPVINDCIEVTYEDAHGIQTTGKEAIIHDGHGTVEWEELNHTDAVYVKWTKDGESGSGTLDLTGDGKYAEIETI